MRVSLGIATWIIQDGNYGDFTRGDRIEIAVEAEFEELTRVEQQPPSCKVGETNAWTDSGDYVLECELLEEPPKRTSTTAVYP
jgi:hypothetical protein